MKRLGIFVACAAMLVMGCGAEPEAPASAAPDDSASETVSQTVIQMLPDGTYLQSTRHISRAEQQAQFEAREALQQGAANGERGLTRQTAGELHIDCNNLDALWLYDQPNRGGNQLCLYRSPSDSTAWLLLMYVPRGAGTTWSGAVRSLWAGRDAGALQNCTPTLCYISPVQVFSAWQAINSISGVNLTNAYLHD